MCRLVCDEHSSLYYRNSITSLCRCSVVWSRGRHTSIFGTDMCTDVTDFVKVLGESVVVQRFGKWVLILVCMR